MTRLFRGALVTLAILSAGCDKPASEAIVAQLRDGGGPIALDEVAGFEWDQLFVFEPYTPVRHICRALSMTAEACSRSDLRDVGEGYFLLVFMDGQTLSYVEEISRRTANFNDTCVGHPIARESTRFVVERPHGNTYLACRS